MSASDTIVVACPSCNSKFQASVAASGKILQCLNCNGPVMVPDVPQPGDELWGIESDLPLLPDFENIIVTTGDLKHEYRVIGPIYFQLSNKGILPIDFRKYELKHQEWLNKQQKKRQIRSYSGWSLLYGEWAVGQSQFDNAFFIAVQELKIRAAMLHADAVISMRQDMSLDTVGVQGFYLQMYGTAVKLL